MKRNLKQLSNKEYDLLVIGGGIYGACIAWDASLKGLSVALVEKGDFGNATSSNSLRTIHGGLRYLQHADFKRMRESIKERSILMRIAPHLVHPIPFLMPTYGLKRGKTVMTIALCLNDLISFDRNRNRDPQKNIPKGRIITKAECIKLFPQVKQQSLTGGAIWYDCCVYNSERLLLSFILSAAESGSDIANYLKVTGFLEKGNSVRGVTVEDELGKGTFDIKAKITVNATGPWIDNILNLLRAYKSERRFRPSVAFNIVVPSYGNKTALAIYGKKLFHGNGELSHSGSKLFIVLPWRNCSVIGTAHLPFEGDPDEFVVKEEHVSNFIREFNSCHADINLKREEVKFIFGGLLPMEKRNGESDEVVLTKQYKIYDHKEDEGIEGIVTVSGVKYTTARDVAEKVVDLVMKKLEKRTSKSDSKINPVYGGNIERFKDFMASETKRIANGVSVETIHHLIQNYGSAYTDIMGYIEKDRELGKFVSEKSEITKAEIIHSIREEMALKLSDVIFRRTEAGTLGNPGRELIENCASIMSQELGWSRKKTEDEINEVNKIFINITGFN